MTVSTSYKIQTLKRGKWMVDSVYDKKDIARQEARKMLDQNKHFDGVKVFEEAYDDSNDPTKTLVILTELRSERKARLEKLSKKKIKSDSAKPLLKMAPKPKKKKFSFTQYIGLMVICVCSITLGVIGFAAYYRYMA